MNCFYSLVIIFFSTSWIIGITSTQLHFYMSPEERHEIFGTSDINVPEYRPTQIAHSITKRDSQKINKMSLNIFDEVVNLTIYETSSTVLLDTPVWLATGTPDSQYVDFTRLNKDTFKYTIKFCKDFDNSTSVGIFYDKDEKMHFTVHMLGNYSIKKIPESLHKKWIEFYEKSNNSSVKKTSETPILEDHYIVIKRSIIGEGFLHAYNAVFGQDNNDSTESTSSSSSSHYNGPKIINPKMLIVANYQMQYKSAETDIRFHQLLVYLVCFWNAVNLEFSSFKEPQIIFHIAGIIVIKNKWGAPYYQKLIFGDISYGQSALMGFTEYLNNFDDVYNLWDIAVSQSDIQLAELNRKYQLFSVLGISYANKICSIEESDQYRKVALIRDDFHFNGIYPAAHEIGHIFGATHDGNGDSACDNNGYIMSPRSQRIYKANVDSWSSCSKRVILKQFRENKPESCLRTMSLDMSVNKLPKLLPGNIFSIIEQCAARGYRKSCNRTLTTCKNLFCSNDNEPDGKYLISQCKNTGDPYSGTICGKYKHCKNRNCVPITI